MQSYRFIRAAGAITLFLLALIAFTPLANKAGNLLMVDTVPAPCDAIVVLGGGMGRDGELSEDSLRRTLRGIELYKKGLAPLIIFSGPVRRGARIPSEAEARFRLATELGIPPQAIVKVDRANTTHEEALQVLSLMTNPSERRVLLVTSSFHLRRAELAFEHAGFHVAPSASDSYAKAASSAGSRLWLMMRIGQEVIGLAYYKTAGYL